MCGACTVLIDGHSARSCLFFAVQADGSRIETVESLGTIDALSPLQEAFREHHALQCGFCTPGMLMTCVDLLRKYPLATDDEIRAGLSGNLCRCTGYQQHRPGGAGGRRQRLAAMTDAVAGLAAEEHRGAGEARRGPAPLDRPGHVHRRP